MKSKIFYAIALLALFLTSCNKDDPAVTEDPQLKIQAPPDRGETIEHEGVTYPVKSLEEYNEYRVSQGRDPIYTAPDGVIWSSKQQYEKVQKQRSGYHVFRLDPQDPDAGDMELWAQDGGVMYQIVNCQGCTATIGLPWGGDHCSILTDYQIFLFDIHFNPYEWPPQWCNKVDLEYLVNYSTNIDTDVQDQHSNISIPSLGIYYSDKTTMIAVKDGTQNTPSESAIRIGYCGTNNWTDDCSDYPDPPDI